MGHLKFTLTSEQSDHMLQHQKLIKSYAYKFASPYFPFEDAVSVANIGFAKGLRKYTPSMGSVATRCAKFVQGELIKERFTKYNRIHFNQTALKHYQKFQAQKKLLQEQCEHNVTFDEVMAFAPELEKIRDSLVSIFSAHTDSLDQVAANEEAEEKPYKHELIAANDSYEPDRILDANMHSSIMKKILAAIEELPERDQKIISRRLGINGYEKLTLNEASKVFNVSAERVRQLEKQAKLKLRELLTAQGLEPRIFH